jgi:glutamyl-tRNA synthetase
MSHSEKYRGRLAPSPTGFLHLGHARTFWVAQERARQNGGELILRNEDLDSTRFKMEFVGAMLEDLRWFGFEWSEGPDIEGKFAPYNQSERMKFYRAALEKLHAANFIYPCTCSRKDIQQAVTAPHAEGDEPVYSGKCRNNSERDVANKKFSWRFRIPDGETIFFATEISANKNSWLEKILAISLSGGMTMFRRINWRVLLMIPRCKSLKSCAARICSSAPRGRFCFIARLV